MFIKLFKYSINRIILWLVDFVEETYVLGDKDVNIFIHSKLKNKKVYNKHLTF